VSTDTTLLSDWRRRFVSNYPTWVQTPSEEKLHDDFVYFVWYIWRHLRLPNPTKRQRSIARYLQHGPKRRMLEAFRGVGKTWLTCAYALWRLYRDPQERVKIVSANEPKATENAVFMRRLIDEVDILQFLRPRDNQRDSVLVFDVGPADAHPTASVTAVGITGQLTGGRATILIADDIEVPKNSYTEGMRERLAELVKEFDALVVPEGFDIIYLGTPQTEQSIYVRVRQRGYDCRIWPARYPDLALQAKYAGALAEDVIADLTMNPKLVGTTTDGERFSDIDLAEREGSYGRSGFALQFMLDTTLSDALKYPLKQNDMIAFDCHVDVAPVRIAWSSDPRYVLDGIPNVGLSGDRLYRPMHTSVETSVYTGACMVIDPSGRGKDQTAVCVIKSLQGQLYLTALKGMKGGYEPESLQAIADLAKLQKVKHVLIESNFGDGMFQKLLEPYLAKTHPVTIEEYRSVGQKELRIIDDLEPVLNQHRLAVDITVLREDAKLAEDDPRYSFLYQLTHITKARGALRHDDKVEVVSRGCRYFRDNMAIDHAKAEAAHKERLRDEEFKKYEAGAMLSHLNQQPPARQSWIKVQRGPLSRRHQR
jgi:hypothetical protein